MSNLVNLDYDAAHDYVDRMQKSGLNVRWNGWTIESHRPHSKAYFAKNGVYRNGKWGFVTSIHPDANGQWRVREHTTTVRS